jgi:hypothetical protein
MIFVVGPPKERRLSVKGMKKVAIIVATVILLVACFLELWPPFYPAVVNLNPDPTVEYLQIMGILSPVGLSLVTIIIGAIAIAWGLYLER